MAESNSVNLSSLRISREQNGGSRPTKRIKASRRKLILWGIVLAVVLLVFVLSIVVRPAPHVETASVQLVYPSQLNRVLVASGYVVAQRKAAVASKATGRLVELTVVEGDFIRRNTVIARIESADMEAQVAQAKSNIESARAVLAQAQAEAVDAAAQHVRVKALLESGSSAKSEFDVAEARHKRAIAGIAAAEAGIRAAEASLRAMQVQLDNTVIRAPFDGTVLTKDADVGEVVAPFGAATSARGAVVTMADMSSLEVEADVSESNIQKISSGQPCEITLDAYPDMRYRGMVSKVVPTADRAKATVLTKIRFENLDARVLPEMSAKVSFLPMDAGREVFEQKPRMMANPSSILRKDGGTYVFVVKDDTLSLRRVTLGGQHGTMVEVKDGVATGERLALNPEDSWSDGMAVITDAE